MRSGSALARNSEWPRESELVGEIRSREELNYWPHDIDARLRNIERLISCMHAPHDAETRWMDYLAMLPARGLASPDVSVATGELWDNILDVAPLGVPDASPTNDAGLLMSWDHGEHHLEIEVLSDTSYEWFYRNRRTNDTESGAVPSIEELPEALATRIARLQV